MEPLLGIEPSLHAYEACVTSNMTREALLQIVNNCECGKNFNLNWSPLSDLTRLRRRLQLRASTASA